MSLKEQGFSFIVRKRPDGGLDILGWQDKPEPGDIDATDMPDDEFERLVESAYLSRTQP